MNFRAMTDDELFIKIQLLKDRIAEIEAKGDTALVGERIKAAVQQRLLFSAHLEVLRREANVNDIPF